MVPGSINVKFYQSQFQGKWFSPALGKMVCKVSHRINSSVKPQQPQCIHVPDLQDSDSPFSLVHREYNILYDYTSGVTFSFYLVITEEEWLFHIFSCPALFQILLLTPNQKQLHGKVFFFFFYSWSFFKNIFSHLYDTRIDNLKCNLMLFWQFEMQSDIIFSKSLRIYRIIFKIQIPPGSR